MRAVPAWYGRRGVLQDAEAYCRSGAHFDRRDTHFAIALGEMPVTHREQRPLNGDWQQEFGTLW